MSNPGGLERDEDDYMSMVFTDTPTEPETSLQRRQRLKREAERRGRVKSKAELAAEEAAKREAGLSTSLLSAGAGAGAAAANAGAALKRSKGYAMMAKMGFKAGSALGRPQGQVQSPQTSGVGDGAEENTKEEDARLLEPVRIKIKEGRGGIGLEIERKRKFREGFGLGDGEDGGVSNDDEGHPIKQPRVVDEGEYRDRVRRDRETARKERILHAAQKVAERMDEKDDDDDDSASPSDGAAQEVDDEERSRKRKPAASGNRPLKSIPVLWRGLVRGREEDERDRRMRHNLQQSLSSRLPTYEDDEEDEDDRRALGKNGASVYVTAEDLDEEDSELDEFNALDVDERLRMLVAHLRERYHYCFWCKFRYPDAEMEGCPGKTEEDHD